MTTTPKAARTSWIAGAFAALATAALCGCGKDSLPSPEEAQIKTAVAALLPPDRRAAVAIDSGALGDPLNLAFAGTAAQLANAARAAGWIPADPSNAANDNRLINAVLAHEPYPAAPMSDLYVAGDRQDAAFEKPSGPDPTTRHHVRFWQSNTRDALGRPLWVGAATYDNGVAQSKVNKRMTHSIAPEVDAERDKVAEEFAKAAGLRQAWIEQYQPRSRGQNGGGFPFETDMRLRLMVAPAESK